MNLHGIAAPFVKAVNPLTLLDLRISTGSVINPDKSRTPTYATPGSFTGSITSNVLTVTAITQGKIQLGQMIAGAGLTRTRVVSYGTGTGGVGTYGVSPSPDVTSEVMTTTRQVFGQVQSLTFKDITQLDSLNIQGMQRAVYITGSVDGLVRETNQGGDMIKLPDGTWWLTTHVLEKWPDWCKIAITQQNKGVPTS